jgi:hypothetical protein
MSSVQRFPAVELFPLCGGQRDIGWREAIPELLDELEALRRGESGDVNLRGGHGGNIVVRMRARNGGVDV